MIDTQRLGALLRTLMQDDERVLRLRTPAASAMRALAQVGPELASPQDEAAGELATRSAPTGLPARSTGMPPAVPPSAALDLSDLGVILRDTLRPTPGEVALLARSTAFGDSKPTSDAPATSRARPLASVPPHSEYATDRLALQVKDAIEFSGLFYESHLAQWADGLRPRALLAHEPQARWVADNTQGQAATGSPNTVTDASGATRPVHNADFASPLVRQQLELLDTGRITWRGDLWPGQPGTLLLEQDDPPARGPTEPMPAPRWRLRIELDFAGLGTVTATLGLCGEALDVALRCGDAATVARLRDAAPVLRAAITARDLALDSLAIADGRA